VKPEYGSFAHAIGTWYGGSGVKFNVVLAPSLDRMIKTPHLNCFPVLDLMVRVLSLPESKSNVWSGHRHFQQFVVDEDVEAAFLDLTGLRIARRDQMQTTPSRIAPETLWNHPKSRLRMEPTTP
jgi:hypothetical protein